MKYLGFIPTICAIKMAATASYKAVPSILIVAPIGRMNLDILASTLLPFSRLLTVTGNVAELLAVPNAVARAGPIYKPKFVNFKSANIMSLFLPFQ